jgi:DNA ligase-associated metallophosphoesterase
MLEIEVAGAPVHLLAQRAAFLPDASTLLVADAHIGKAVSFRRLGVPVPRGTTAQTLATLDTLLAATQARRIVFLGDLLHARRGRAEATAAAAWRARHAAVELVLVRGNHDRHAGDPPREWGVAVVGTVLRLGPFALAHLPQPLAGAYVLAGHLHPAAVVGAGWERLRLPCFHFGAEVGVLPAFGAFTGMHTVRRAASDRVYVIAGDAVRPLHSLP